MDSLSIVQFVYCGFVIFAAYVVRGTAGFGGGLVAMPLLLMVLPISTVLPVIAVLNMLSSLQAMRVREHIQWMELAKLIPPTIVGVLLGWFVFKTIDLDPLTKFFAAFLILYALYSLYESKRTKNADGEKMMPKWVLFPVGVIAGFIAMIFGGAGGGFYAVYLDGRRLPRHQFRATVTTILLVVSVSRSVGYYQLGFFHQETVMLLAAALPLMFLGSWVANRLLNRMSDLNFRVIISILLIASGITLFFK